MQTSFFFWNPNSLEATWFSFKRIATFIMILLVGWPILSAKKIKCKIYKRDRNAYFDRNLSSLSFVGNN